VDARVLWLILAGFLGELLGSSLGMLYGTILLPVLIIAGYDPLVVVPSILITQAIAGFVAAIDHHRLRNVDFSVDNGEIKKATGARLINSLRSAITRDSKVVLVVSALGILSSVIAVAVAASIPKAALNTYIGVLVLVMGAILVSRSSFRFSWITGHLASAGSATQDKKREQKKVACPLFWRRKYDTGHRWCWVCGKSLREGASPAEARGCHLR